MIVFKPITVPEEEIEAAEALQYLVWSMDRFIHDFQSALSLFNFCSRYASLAGHNWALVPARDGAMSLFHLFSTMEAIGNWFGDCPTWRSMVDHEIRRQSLREYKAAFPFCEKLRHSIAHSGELYKNKQRAKENAVTGSFTRGPITLNAGGRGSAKGGSLLLGDELCVPISGAFISYRINRDALAAMIKAREGTLDAFAPLIEMRDLTL